MLEQVLAWACMVSFQLCVNKDVRTDVDWLFKMSSQFGQM